MFPKIERYTGRSMSVFATSLILAILAIVLVRRSGLSVTQEEVSGSYRPEVPFFLDNEVTWSRIDLDIEGTLTMTDLNGSTTAKGTWWWDASEGLLHSDVPDLNERIFGHVGWMGKQLQWRCSRWSTEMVELHPLD
jgi:hypothetical protein